MKTIRTISFVALLLTALTSCKTNNLVQEVKKQQTRTMIETMDYIFEARSASPMSANTIQLTPGYTLKINKGSIEANFPYYGRAYSAPMNADEAGIKFVSINYDYAVMDNTAKKKRWDIDIVAKDSKQNFQLKLSIGENGYGTLTVQSDNKQTISFYGYLKDAPKN